MSLSERERSIRQRLKDNLPHYAAKCLKIRTKTGAIEPFVLNRAQLFIHERLEAQIERTGKVRALILKGRQQGCSTYVGARFYHRCTHSSGLRVFILTHEDAATQNLFEMVDRYHDHCPAAVKPSTGSANAKELNFDRLDSGYKVGTAGTKGVGRSSTIQLMHGSEVAFWPNADSHAAGVLQAVPDVPGTEVILESTANGLGNLFHQRWRDAENGTSDYIAIFVPWYWQDEYRVDVPPDFLPDAEEEKYAKLYGLDEGQLAWRRGKLAELKDPLLFKQEYPATAAEAFQTTGHDSYIPPDLILKARKGNVHPSGPLVVGYDPAWKGSDRHAMAFRKGRRVVRIDVRHKLDTMQGAGWAKQVIDTYRPAKMFIDVGGVGAGVCDRLGELGYGETAIPVNFGSAPFESRAEGKGGPFNRRAEMWMKSKEWLSHPAGVQIPDSDSLQADACAPSYSYNSHSELLLESKDHIRARNVPSPDEWDAVALTFAEPVMDIGPEEEETERRQVAQSRSSITGY